MPRIFDNIELTLLPDLQKAIEASYLADFSVGYFNLGVLKHLDQWIDNWQGSSAWYLPVLWLINQER